jgi:predicted N-acetyltransferase YhbS
LDCRQQGIGTAATSFILQEAAKRNLPVILTSSTQAWPIYKRFGFVQTGEVVFKQDGQVLQLEPEPVAILEAPGQSSGTSVQESSL